MSIHLNSHCVDCLMGRYLKAAREYGDAQTAYDFAKGVMQLFLEAEPDANSSRLGARITQLAKEFYNLPEDQYLAEKETSNRFVLERLDSIRRQVRQSDDPVLTALQYAILGNYIDFSALGKSVSFERLEQMLLHPENFAFDPAYYPTFCRDMDKAKNLLYITDNAGEIGFDWVLADELVRRWPQLKITFCVRGMPTYNDATCQDYAFMGIPYPVIENGSNIAGTDPKYVNQETLDALGNADVILSKGMGNTETLYGSGYPIYFAFLVKCKRIEEVFGKPHMTPMFVKEPEGV